MGLSQERRFVNYHRVLNRARWRGREASRLLLGLLVPRFVPTGPLLLGIDDTIERRRGKRIQAKGIYRDPVRSSHSHFVKASGLRWVSLMLLNQSTAESDTHATAESGRAACFCKACVTSASW